MSDILNEIPLTSYNRTKIKDMCKKNHISIECFLAYAVEMLLQSKDLENSSKDSSEV